MFEEIPLDEQTKIFRILPKDIAADVFSYLDHDVQQTIVEGISDRELALIVDDLYLDDTVDFLEEMERKMPSSLLLMSAVCDEQGVTLNIVTPGMEEADVVIKQLRSFASIQQMDVSTITEITDEGGISSATFSVRCGYNQPEEPESPAQTAD